MWQWIKTENKSFKFYTMAVTNRKMCYFAVWTPTGKFIDIVSFDGIMWKDIKERLITFYEDFSLFQEMVD